MKNCIVRGRAFFWEGGKFPFVNPFSDEWIHNALRENMAEFLKYFKNGRLNEA